MKIAMYLSKLSHAKDFKVIFYLVVFSFTISIYGLFLVNQVVAQSATISGLGEFNYRYFGPGEGQEEANSGFSIEDVMFFVKGSSGDKVDFFSEFIINPKSADEHLETAHDQSVAIERLYVSSSAVIPHHTVKAGLFHVFDGPIQGYHSARGNPLPGDLIFYRNPWLGHHGPRSLHDIFHELGVSITGMQLPVMYTVSVFNGLGERTPSGNQFDNAKLSGTFAKVQYISQQLRGLRAGLSFYYAEGLETKATDQDGNFVGPEVAPVNQYWVGEIVYQKPFVKLTALYLQGVQSRAVSNGMYEEYNMPYGKFDHEGRSLMGEVMYNWTDSFATIGRYQALLPNDRIGTNFIGAGAQVSHGSVEDRGVLNQVEVGVKYDFTERFSIKGSWLGNYEEEADILGNIVMGQLTAAF